MKPKFATIIEAGRARREPVHAYNAMPLDGQFRVEGLLNGRPYPFRQTRGPIYFYAYFKLLDDSIWYVRMSDGYLSEGAQVIFPHIDDREAA